MMERVPSALDGERVDRVVAMLTGLPRAEAAGLVDAGLVQIGGRVLGSRSRKVHTGERLEIDAPLVPAGPVILQPAPGVEVPVVYSDDSVIVVDKPAGLVVHPGAGNPDATMVQGLLAAFPDIESLATGDAAQRPGIVQRLDKGTSGLIVVARTEVARVSLVAQLTARSAERGYTTLVAGAVEADEGLIDAPIGRDEAIATRMAVRNSGRPARTGYRVERRFRDPIPASLLTCRLETGRTHQIRVHLSAIGHPVVGDERYGGPLPAGARRPFLHAAVLGFDHPVSGERLRFVSALPPELERVLGRFS
jgi:23S rRNA pseudouridine1911/1915/1917 synthase